AIVANHERTRQRFRRIWWIDRPDRLDQTLALALNLPHLRSETNPAERRAALAGQLDDHTLLIIDHLRDGDLRIGALPRLTDHVLLAVETDAEAPDPAEPPEEDPAGVVTLRALAESAAIEALAQHAGIHDTRRIRGELGRLSGALSRHPFALAVAGHLISRDGLSLAELEDTLGEMRAPPAIEDDRSPEELAAEALAAHQASISRPLAVSVDALPGDYRALLAALSLFPADGAPFEALHAVAGLESPLATRRGLLMLSEYGLIQLDHRDPWRATLPSLAADCAQSLAPESFPQAGCDRLIAWAQGFASTHAADAATLYRAESALGHALDVAAQGSAPRRARRLLGTRRPDLREYAPDRLPPGDAQRAPELTG